MPSQPAETGTASRPPVFHVVLHEPEIPNNTGNIGRTCVATGCSLHLIHPLGFDTSEKACRRAGLDYWPEVKLVRHRKLDSLYESLPEARFIYLTTKADRIYTDCEFQPHDCLVFGRETRGLPEDLLRANWENCLRIPILNPNIRSLNLATAAGIVLFEALRQTGQFQ